MGLENPFLYPKNMMFRTCLVTQAGDFPGGPVVKNLLCNAGDTVSIPGQRIKIPHALEQLSPYTAAPKSMCHN